MNKNILLNTDSYKASHFAMYPPGCETLSCYIESRGGPFDATVFFGLQAFLLEYLSDPITATDIDEAEGILTAHGLPFNRPAWEYILDKHQGYLPIEIEAVAEGTIVPVHNVLLQIKNTDPACYWLPTYLETALLRAIWYPTTVATTSWECKEILRQYLMETADTLDALPWQLHDFGARGVSSNESAALGGLAHLVNFFGTDTLAAVLAAKRYYGEDMAGFSIPAAEHSTIISWGQDNETEAYQQILEAYSGKDKLVAIVCDSYNIWDALKEIFGSQLKTLVESNEGRLVLRPDSGKPEEVVVKVIEILMDKFGSSTNNKGYKLLPDNIRVIQGDGVNTKSIESCLQCMKKQRLSADNIVFGMGGALLQRVHRDTAKFAMKASAAKINGQWRDVKKEPITDLGKTSKGGQLALVKDATGKFKTIRLRELGKQKNNLRTVFKDGKLVIKDDLSSIRERTKQPNRS
jgi:nicotinamide phosphoribosyltransferase